MLLQVWVRGRRKNTRSLASPGRARGFFLQICFATSTEFWELVTDLAFGTPKTLAVPPYKYARVPPHRKKSNTQDAQHASTCLLRRRRSL
jgi:hypothetical protein